MLHRKCIECGDVYGEKINSRDVNSVSGGICNLCFLKYLCQKIFNAKAKIRLVREDNCPTVHLEEHLDFLEKLYHKKVTEV